MQVFQLLVSWLGRWDFLGSIRLTQSFEPIQPFDRSCEQGMCGGED